MERSSMDIIKGWGDYKKKAEIGPKEKYFQIGLAGTMTLEIFEPYLGSLLIDEGFNVNLTVAPYNQVFQTCLEPAKSFKGQNVNAIVLLWRIDDLCGDDLLSYVCGDNQVFTKIIEKVSQLAQAIGHLREKFNGLILVSLPEWPHNEIINCRSLVFQNRVTDLYGKVTGQFQKELKTLNDIYYLDMSGIQRFVGVEKGYDSRSSYLYRCPYSIKMMRCLAEEITHFFKSKLKAAKKCIVLDCDNTLWGGVVGEDGLEGIELGNDFPGRAYKDFQRQLLVLHKQGTLLTLCSKNNEADVFEVFEKHDEMVLKKEHIAAYRINWQPKSRNIVEIAGELNIGIESLVFVDDNPVEIEEVRTELPEIECLLVDEDVAFFPDNFSAYRGFDKLELTREDRDRSEMIIVETKRQNLRASVSEVDFLNSLGLKIKVAPMDRVDLARVTQLINKTNQFNLTTRRRTSEEVGSLLGQSEYRIFTLRVDDNFGAYGLVGVGIFSIKNNTAVLDSFLISCRVLGRGVEDAFLSSISRGLHKEGIIELEGHFIPTHKNQPAAGFLQRHGFIKGEGSSWSLALTELPLFPSHISQES
jgi:FkbH-like protein